jgi:hypothetical protein
LPSACCCHCRSALFAYALRHGAWFTRLESFAQRMLGDDHKLAALIDGARLDAQIRALCRHYGVLVRTLMADDRAGRRHARSLVGTIAAQPPVSFGEALAIRADARRTPGGVLLPAGLEVQEAVIVLLGTSFGIDPQTSLALALVKRAKSCSGCRRCCRGSGWSGGRCGGGSPVESPG